jgi:hypothetical protein
MSHNPWDPPNWDASDCVLGVFGQLLMMSGPVHGLGSMMFGLAVQKFWNIEWFLHWKSTFHLKVVLGLALALGWELRFSIFTIVKLWTSFCNGFCPFVSPCPWNTAHGMNTGEKGRTLSKTYGIKARCYWEHPWGTHWEHLWNLMGTWREHVGNKEKMKKKILPLHIHITISPCPCCNIATSNIAVSPTPHWAVRQNFLQAAQFLFLKQFFWFARFLKLNPFSAQLSAPKKRLPTQIYCSTLAISTHVHQIIN